MRDVNVYSRLGALNSSCSTTTVVRPGAAPTRSEDVYSRLRGDILAGRLRPGSRLPFAELCARYGTSVGVVREGLSRLTEQALVVAEPQLGYRVKSVSSQDLQHLTDARVEIETLVVRSAIEAGDLAWESSVVAAHHTLARTPQMDSQDPQRMTEAWAAAHAVYHSSLLDGCPNPRLRAIALALRDSAELYRRWSVPVGHDSGRDVAQEHESLLAAALGRDAAGATSVLTEHLRRTARVLLDVAPDDEHLLATLGAV